MCEFGICSHKKNNEMKPVTILKHTTSVFLLNCSNIKKFFRFFITFFSAKT